MNEYNMLYDPGMDKFKNCSLYTAVREHGLIKVGESVEQD